MKKNYSLLLTGIGLLLTAQLSAQNTCVPCGTGSNGAFTASANTTIAGGTYNYSSFTIVSGVTVTVTGTQPLIIRCTGAVVINGTLDASGGNGTNGITFTAAGTGGIGVAGGQNGGNGTYSTSLGGMLAQDGAGAGGVTTAGNGWSGGGGAGYGAAGTASGGSTGGFAGPVYGDAQLSAILGGSGGGGGSGGFSCGSGGGGAGGGYIEITACSGITIGATGVVRANGGNGGSDGTGNCGGGGGGSGGTVWLGAPSIVNNGQVRATGGSGGASAVPGAPYYGTGANGANGRIRIDGVLTGTGNLLPANVFIGQALSVTTSSSVLSVCTGNSTTFSASGANGIGAYTYNWMPGNLTTPSITVSPTANTVYTVTVTDAANCTSTASVTVNVNTLPIVTLSSNGNTLCPGGSQTLTGSSGGTSQWYHNGVLIPAATSPSYTATLPGVYNMMKTNLNTCFDSAAVGITLFSVPAPTVSLGNDTALCQSTNPFTLSAQTTATTYLWSTGSTQNSIPVSSSGVYSVDVTDSNGCVGSDTATITIYPLPVIAFVPAQDSFCLTTGPVALTATPAGGTFSGPGMSGNTFTAATAGVGVHSISYTYVDSLGCAAASTVAFTVDVCTDFNPSTAQTIFTATPNPSNGLFAVTVSLPGTLVIYTIEGREVYSVQHNTAGRSDVDLSSFGSGMYLLRYVYEGGQAAARVSVQ